METKTRTMRLLTRQSVGPLLGLLSHQRPLVAGFLLNCHKRVAKRATRLAMSSSSAANNASGNSDATPKVATVIAQYIFLRRDLDWPAGAMAAQAAHASVAAIAQGLAAQHVPTAAYVSAENLPRMTKMVYGVDNLEQLEQVRDTWNTFIQSSNEVDASIENTTTPGECLHAYWWVEQPENIPSALATWPLIRTNKVSKLIKKLKLSYF